MAILRMNSQCAEQARYKKAMVHISTVDSIPDGKGYFKRKSKASSVHENGGAIHHCCISKYISTQSTELSTSTDTVKASFFGEIHMFNISVYIIDMESIENSER